MDYHKLLEDYVSFQKRTLAFESLETGTEEIEFINEHLNAFYLAFKKNYSMEETENLKKELTKFNFKTLSTPVSKKKIQEAEDFLSYC